MNKKNIVRVETEKRRKIQYNIIIIDEFVFYFLSLTPAGESLHIIFIERILYYDDKSILTGQL